MIINQFFLITHVMKELVKTILTKCSSFINFLKKKKENKNKPKNTKN